MTRIIEVRALQVYFYSYLIHVNSTITTNSFVPGTATNVIKTPVYYRPGVSFQLARKILSPHFGKLYGHISDQTQNKSPMISAENFKRLLFAESQISDTVTTLSQKEDESLRVTNTIINLKRTP